jgi:hypothetical protein
MRHQALAASEDGDAAASVIEEAEYSFLLDTGRLDDRVWPKGFPWPKFWSDEQRRVACASDRTAQGGAASRKVRFGWVLVYNPPW